MRNKMLDKHSYGRLSQEERKEVKKKLCSPEGEYVTIRIENRHLYGVYFKSKEMKREYDNSGGLWGYIPVDQLRNEIASWETSVE